MVHTPQFESHWFRLAVSLTWAWLSTVCFSRNPWWWQRSPLEEQLWVLLHRDHWTGKVTIYWNPVLSIFTFIVWLSCGIAVFAYQLCWCLKYLVKNSDPDWWCQNKYTLWKCCTHTVYMITQNMVQLNIRKIGILILLPPFVVFRGRFSVAKRCDQRGSKRTVAAKHVNKKLLRREQVLQEIRLLQTLDHPNLVKLLDTYETASSYVLILEM